MIIITVVIIDQWSPSGHNCYPNLVWHWWRFNDKGAVTLYPHVSATRHDSLLSTVRISRRRRRRHAAWKRRHKFNWHFETVWPRKFAQPLARVGIGRRTDGDRWIDETSGEETGHRCRSDYLSIDLSHVKMGISIQLLNDRETGENCWKIFSAKKRYS